MAEEIRGVTWDLDGPQLQPWLAAQRLYKAGFKDADELCIMWAVIESESGGYLKAWHHNVVRNEDTSIKLVNGKMEVKSTDLGFIQKNVVHSPTVMLPVEGNESQLFVDSLWEKYPNLARADESAKIARQLFLQRGYQPWFAHTNGSYKKNLGRGAVAVANYLALKHGLRPMPHVRRVVN